MWEPAPEPLMLGPRDVHVWKAPSRASQDGLRQYLESFSEDERARAARFHFERGRVNYICARGVLRELLGRYLSVAPAAVQLAYTSHGKPVLDPAHASDVQFNLAHSGDLVLLAFARAGRVGIDVERCRPDFDGQRIADRFFTELESSRLRASSESERVAAFTRQWTRKESFIKAHGEGLSYPLNAFSIIEDNSGALRIEADTSPNADVWHIEDIDAGEDYAAAITIECTEPVLSTFSI